jgi:hypothetical protein
MLPGMKTYIISGLMILKSLYEMFTGDVGTIQAPDYNLLMEGLGLGALRAGVAKK